MALFKNDRAPDPPDLIERIETIERQMRNLKLEWAEAYDKLEHSLKRLAKRQSDESARETHEVAPGPKNGGRAGASHRVGFTSAQERILARRMQRPHPTEGGSD